MLSLAPEVGEIGLCPVFVALVAVLLEAGWAGPVVAEAWAADVAVVAVAISQWNG